MSNSTSLGDLLHAQMKLPPNDPQSVLFAARKVTAIKRLRTGVRVMGLKEAKDTVELIQHATPDNILETCQKLQRLLTPLVFEPPQDAIDVIEALVAKDWPEYKVVNLVQTAFPDVAREQIIDRVRFTQDKQRGPF